MKDTVFVPAFGNRPRNLVGREEIIQLFDDSLQSTPGSRDRAILILGQRGSGKTVLLLELAEMAKKRGMIVASPTVVSKEMPDRILEKLSTAGEEFIEKPRPRLSGGSVSMFGFGGGVELAHDNYPNRSFAWRLSKICDDINSYGKAVLILIDEVQASNDELRQLIVAYQEMVGEGKDIFLVLAGLPMTISSVLNDHVLTFLNRASKIQLPPLRISDIEAYYHNSFEQLSITLSNENINCAAQETSGSPYLMQLIGHYLVLRADENGCISDDRFRAAIIKAKEDFMNDICQTTLAPLSDQDIAFLAAMAKDERSSKMADIIARLSCTSSLAQTYKRRLIHAGVIEQYRRGEVRFAVPYLRDYLYNAYSDY